MTPADVVSLTTSLANIPFVDVSIDVLHAFFSDVENVKIFRQQCKDLRDRCVILLNALLDNTTDFHSDDAKKAVDELEPVLLRIVKRMHKWSSLSNLKSFVHQGEIKDGIDNSYRDIETFALKFHIMIGMDSNRMHKESLASRDRDRVEMRDFLTDLISQLNFKDISKTQPVVEGLMQSIQEELRAPDLAETTGKPLRRGLWTLYQESNRLPPLIDLSGQVRKLNTEPIRRGAFNDIFEGLWLDEELVALRFTRALTNDPDAQRRFRKEVEMWRHLQHPNVTRLFGIAYFGDDIYAVSEWMDQGDAITYVRSHPDADTLKLLYEIASGMEYLHSHQIVHGDLRGANVLIAQSGKACLSDFGLSKFLEQINDSLPSISSGSTPYRWQAPELLRPDLIGKTVPSLSRQSDVWSFGMLCLELYTNSVPFADMQLDLAVAFAVVEGKLPARPPLSAPRALSNELWDLMLRCWNRQPDARPSMTDIKANLKRLRGGRPGSSSSTRTTFSVNTPFSYHQGLSQPTDTLATTDTADNASTSQTIQQHSVRRASTSSTSPLSPITPDRSHRAESIETVSTPSSRTLRGNAKKLSELLEDVPQPNFPENPPNDASLLLGNGQRKATQSEPSVATLQIGVDPSRDRDELLRERSGSFPRRSGSQPSIPIAGSRQNSVHDRSSLLALPAGPSSASSHLSSSPDHIPSDESFVAEQGSAPSPSTSRSSLDIAISDPSRLVQCSRKGVVEAGTLEGLVDRLVKDSSDFRKHMKYCRVFVNTYTSFTDTDTVFTSLERRFRTAETLTVGEKLAMRQNVLWVLKQWLSSSSANISFRILSRMWDLCASVKEPAAADLISELLNKIDKRRNALSPFHRDAPLPVPSSREPAVKASEIVQQDLALALYILQRAQFAALAPADYIAHCQRQSENRVAQALALGADVVSWVQMSILQSERVEARVGHLKFFVETAEQCRKMSDFASTAAIMTALRSETIARLQVTLDSLQRDRSTHKALKKLQALFAPLKGYHAYKEALRQCANEAIPWLEVHLKDIDAVYSQEPTIEIESRALIDFTRCEALFEQTEAMGAYAPPTMPPGAAFRRAGTRGYLEAQLARVRGIPDLAGVLERRAEDFRAREAQLASQRVPQLWSVGFGTPDSGRGHRAVK